MDTQVLVIGAGPVGLTLAIDLGQRGVRCTLIEQKPAPARLPKMERCNARTMEMYRRMGIAKRVRRAGLPGHCPMDVFIITSLIEPPLLRLPYPSVDEAMAAIAACDNGTMPLEPYQLISQYTLEPLLKAIAETTPNVTVRYGCELLEFVQDTRLVTAVIGHSDGSAAKVSAGYLVGCDGGSSTVRKQLGVKLQGKSNILHLRQALYRCDDLYGRIPIGKGRHYHVADHQATFLIVQDDTRHFTLHSIVENDQDMADMFEKTVAMPVKYQELFVGTWTQHLLLADAYRLGRVFLAGDAAHLMIPTGGLGMNTGVGDAIDLSWKLAATLQGWGGPGLLASYEIERRQIGARNVAASASAAQGRRAWRAAYRPNIRENTPDGVETRARLAQIANVEQRKSNEMVGAELGYRYVGSPIICNEAGEGPAHQLMEYVPSTWPGTRLPHVWLRDGSALHDKLGQGHTLLRLWGGGGDTTALEGALRATGAPLRVLDIAEEHPRNIYGHDLLLVRPDLHVVWRGHCPPANPQELAAIATGHHL